MCDPVSIGLAVSAVVGAGTAVYSADQARKGQHATMDAQRDAQEADARQKAELETNTAVAANAKFAADKRARQANVLALGGPAGALGGGAQPGTQGAGLGAGQSVTQGPVSVLGQGAPGGGYVPRQAGGGAAPGTPRTRAPATPY